MGYQMSVSETLAADQGHATPPADVAMDAALVRALLADQLPDLAHLPVSFASSGWDNAIYRLGDRLAARMPRRAIAVSLLQTEQSWLPALAPRLPLAIPAPPHVGQPALGYPYPWSVVPWFGGKTASEGGVRADQAGVLVNFLNALHVPAPDDAPTSDCRGLPLATQVETVNIRMARLEGLKPRLCEKIRPVWSSALQADPDFAPKLLHGDLHPRNVIVKDGALLAAIDWGDVCGGDVATDLAAIWFLLPTVAARDEALHLYGADPDMIARAKGWAVRMGLVLLDSGLKDNPEYVRLGEMILHRALES
jgi:aminoglycoside phosphotransferase (APT) family kinase protein